MFELICGNVETQTVRRSLGDHGASLTAPTVAAPNPAQDPPGFGDSALQGVSPQWLLAAGCSGQFPTHRWQTRTGDWGGDSLSTSSLVTAGCCVGLASVLTVTWGFGGVTGGSGFRSTQFRQAGHLLLAGRAGLSPPDTGKRGDCCSPAPHSKWARSRLLPAP